jgi:hypothetical protein
MHKGDSSLEQPTTSTKELVSLKGNVYRKSGKSISLRVEQETISAWSRSRGKQSSFEIENLS